MYTFPLKEIPTRLGARGVSLVELMIAVSILSLGVLGSTGAFRYISKSITVSRARTLAIGLAQEKIENLKELSYYKLQLTTNTTIDNNFSPPLIYDTVNYPVEEILVGGVRFKRGTFVAFANVTGNVISTVTFNYPDPGLKLIQVHVMWQYDNEWKKVSLNNLYENPYVDSLDGTISGTVSRTGGGTVAGAKVTVVEQTDWNGIANSVGDYSFSVAHGTYTVRASSAGFYDQTRVQIGVSSGATADVDFTLTAIASGTVAGQVWVSSNLVISQVVTATNTVVGHGGTEFVEYVALFNPTTVPINIGSGGTQIIKVGYRRNAGDGGTNFCGTDEALTYVSTYVPPSSYYLFANATSFYVLGTQVVADAYWNDNLYDNRFPSGQSGCMYLTTDCSNNSNRIDAVGWSNNGGGTPPADCFEGAAIPLVGQGGLAVGNQIVRISSPGLTSDAYGRAYDSDSNALDFLYPYSGFSGLQYRPFSTVDGAKPVIAGRPAAGANVTADDLLGASTQAYTAYIASNSLQIPYARYDLVGVATGTWTMIVSSGTYFKQIESVSVAASAGTPAPNAATTPAWSLANHPAVSLDSSTVNGYVAGTVVSVTGDPISGIQVQAAGVTKTTGANGRYFASVSSGPIVVVANPTNLNSTYVESVSQVTIQTGQVYTQNFTLAQGGVLRGYATTGTSALPNVAFSATDSGVQYGNASTDSSGNFYIRNLTTGTYTIAPVLDSLETVSPVSVSATVSSTSTVFVGTFTITGALGTLSGEVRNNGALITTGALILASTASIASSPPPIVASSSPARTVIYAASSKADGTYSLEVRGSTSTTYFVSAYIPLIGTGSVSVTTKTYSGITINPSVVTTYNITLP